MRLFGVLLLLVFAPAAANATFIYLQDDRALLVRCYGTVAAERPEPPFSPFDKGGLLIGVLANQQSTLGDETMTMRGTASILTPGACGELSGGSVFEIAFGVTEDTSFVLQGVASYAHLELPGFSGGGSELEVLFEAGEFFGGPPVPVDASGVLLAGRRYILVARARVNWFGPESGNFDLDFSLVPIPEPVASTFVAIGLALLGRHARSSSREVRESSVPD